MTLYWENPGVYSHQFHYILSLSYIIYICSFLCNVYFINVHYLDIKQGRMDQTEIIHIWFVRFNMFFTTQ